MKKKEAIITIAVFLVLLFGLTIWNLLTPDREFSYNENKYLDQMPSFSWEKLLSGEWQEDFESYITDQFIGRDAWVGMNVASERVIGKKDVNGVIFGKDHYMIQMHTPQDVDGELVEKNLERLRLFVEKSKVMVGEEHTSVMLVPTASEVLADKLPSFASGMLYDQKALLERAREQAGAEAWIDAEELLGQHKEEYIFYRTDHHWTMTGAFYAYQEWMSRKGYGSVKLEDYEQVTLSEDFLGTTYSKAPDGSAKADTMLLFEKDPEREYTVYLEGADQGRQGLYDPAKLQEKDKYASYLYGNNGLVEITGGEENGRTLLIIKDSYAHCFATLAAQDFEKVYLIDPRYFLQDVWEFARTHQVTDTLFLFNTMNFAQESYLYILDEA
jgi:hypothetical protein